MAATPVAVQPFPNQGGGTGNSLLITLSGSTDGVVVIFVQRYNTNGDQATIQNPTLDGAAITLEPVNNRGASGKDAHTIGYLAGPTTGSQVTLAWDVSQVHADVSVYVIEVAGMDQTTPKRNAVDVDVASGTSLSEAIGSIQSGDLAIDVVTLSGAAGGDMLPGGQQTERVDAGQTADIYSAISTIPADATSETFTWSWTTARTGVWSAFAVRAATGPDAPTLTNPPGDQDVVLEWTSAQATDELHRSTSSGFTPVDPGTKIADNANGSATDSTVSADTQYYYKATRDGAASPSAELAVKTAPARPTALSATSPGSGQATVSFTDQTGGLHRHQVYGRKGAESFQPLAFLDPGETSVLISNLADGTWEFIARSWNETDDLYSGFSASDTVALGAAPAAATNLQATLVQPDRVDISWTDNATNEDEYELQRSPRGAGTWTTVVDALAPDTTSASDQTVSPSTQYDYRVAAINAFGTTYSATLEVDTPAVPPVVSVTGTRFMWDSRYGLQPVVGGEGSFVRESVAYVQGRRPLPPLGKGQIHDLPAGYPQLEWAGKSGVMPARQGLLIERGSTQLLLGSAFASGVTIPDEWTQPNADGTTAIVESFLGTDRIGTRALRQSGSSGRPYISQQVSLAPNTTYTASVEVEAAAVTAGDLAVMGVFGVGFTGSQSVALPTGSETGRFEFKFTTDGVGGTATIRTGLGVNGVATGTLQVSRPQLEAQPLATSTIPSTDSIVSRAASTLAYPWPYSAQEGVWYFLFIEAGTILTDIARLWQLSNQGANLRIETAGTPARYRFVHDNGVATITATPDVAWSVGDVVEYVARLYSDGSVEAWAAVDFGAFAGPGRTGPLSINEWGERRMHFGSDGSGGNLGRNRFLQLKAVESVAQPEDLRDDVFPVDPRGSFAVAA